MDLTRKKIVILSLASVVGTATGKEQPEDITDFRISKEMIDRLKAMRSVSRIIITHNQEERVFMPLLKAVEFFIFVYCKTAVGTITSCDGLIDSLPHNLRRKELMLSVDDKGTSEQLGVDYIAREDFLSM